MKEQLNRKQVGNFQTATNAEAMRTIIATILAVIFAVGLISLNKTPDTALIQLEQPLIVDALAVADVPQNTVVHTIEQAPEPEPEPVPATCAEEITKHADWNQQIAHAVMMAESGNKADNYNDDASTGDYSIGCFQINLLGYDNLLAKYRDAVALGYSGQMTIQELEQWLKVASNNVAIAHRMYVKSGWQPWQHTTCRYKVKCY